MITLIAEPSIMTKYWMALNSVRGVGPKTVRMLVSRFGSPEKVLSAPVAEIARMPRLNPRLAHEIASVKRNLLGFEKFIAQMSRIGIDVLCPDGCEYPRLLRFTDDFPPILYKKGMELPKDEATVAIVGTRLPTSSGVEAAEGIAEGLANRGIVVVSGLAVGIDTAAHRGALKAGGKTLAVLGSGLKAIYPRENRELANDICGNGAILSECHPNEVVSGRRLVQRNRIISGLSLAIILVEPRSGALNTAERASKHGRYVFLHSSGSGKEIEDMLTGSLPEAVFTIYGTGGLDTVADRLRAAEASVAAENRNGQMHLL